MLLRRIGPGAASEKGREATTSYFGPMAAVLLLVCVILAPTATASNINTANANDRPKYYAGGMKERRSLTDTLVESHYSKTHLTQKNQRCVRPIYIFLFSLLLEEGPGTMWTTVPSTVVWLFIACSPVWGGGGEAPPFG